MRLVAIYAAFACLLFSSAPATAQQWREIALAWEGKPAEIGAGNLKVELVGQGGATSTQNRPVHAFGQELRLAKRAKWVQVSNCGIVDNLDTSGGYASALLLEDGLNLMVHMKTSTSFLVRPRVCISVRD